MGKLIDADKLKAMFQDAECLCALQTAILGIIDAQRTAFNPDKVAKQLEERTAFLNGCTKYDNETVEQQEKSYDTMMMYEVKDLVDDLIEIVRGGGAND